MNRVLLLITLLLIPASLHAADSIIERPHWSLEVKGGDFIPDIQNWAAAYGNRYTSEFEGSLAYRVTKQIEAGIESGRIRDRGQGLEPLHSNQKGYDVYGGDVTYELYPLNVFVLARGVFTADQLVIPYAGGGWTRIFYREEVKNQGVARGSVDGYHARAGLQLLLDPLDPSAANNLYLDYGVYHTYFFIEAEYTRAMADTVSGGSVNLGGTSWLGGFLFEF